MAGLGLLAGCALPGSAPPQAAKVHRIARLIAAPANPEQSIQESAFREGLRDLGYVEGQNLVIEVRHANGRDRIGELAVELVRLQSEVIVVSAAPNARAVLAATTTVPVVSAGADDLVASGLAASHARPGGNVTGLSTPLLTGKQLQLLREAVPSLARVAVLRDANAPDPEPGEPYQTAARTLGLALQMIVAGGPEDLELAFETAVREHAEGVFLPTGSVIANNQSRIAELALQSRLPSMWLQSEAVGRGGLLGYAPNPAAMFQRAAYFVDRILQGDNPGDLPIEQPTQFDFVINLKTAQALGLTIPPHVLAQSTEVLQ
jgi:putative ABC transport system substrate-binding protein